MARPKKGEIGKSPTVSFNITLDRELAEAPDEIAREEMRSRTNQIIWMLQNEVKRRGAKDE